jgi:hypothetical protein
MFLFLGEDLMEMNQMSRAVEGVRLSTNARLLAEQGRGANSLFARQTNVKAPPHRAPRTAPPLPPTPGGSGAGALALRGLAAGLGAWLGYSLPDWIDRLANGRRSFTMQETDSNCDVSDWAGSYLKKLQRHGIDQAVKAVPPRTHSWSLPNGMSVVARQRWGKDGLTFDVELTGQDGKTVKLDNVAVKLQVNSKGGKIRVAESDWVVAGEKFGKLSLDLRVDGRGLNEVELNFTTHRGYVATWKLKPAPCNVDLSTSRLLRINQGSQTEAHRWVQAYLAESAARDGGNLFPGLTNLLLYVEPTASGVYRNHGSEALDVLTRALNVLKDSGVNMAPLEQLQARAKRLPEGSAELGQLRREARAWLQKSVAGAVRGGRIDPVDLRNAFGLNMGVAALASPAGPRLAATKPPKIVRSEPVPSINMPDVIRAVAPAVIKQTRDGRLFVDTRPDHPSFESRLGQLAAVMGVATEQLHWYPATLTIRGVRMNGIVLDARKY